MIKKNLTYYSIKLSEPEIDKINEISKNYISIKNYFFSRYSGIKSYKSIQNHRKEIRDILVEQKFKCNLPSRYWKLALDEVVSNIKSNWSNTINNIKKVINNNKNLTSEEKHYIYYIFKSKQLLFDLLNKNIFIIVP